MSEGRDSQGRYVFGRKGSQITEEFRVVANEASIAADIRVLIARIERRSFPLGDEREQLGRLRIQLFDARRGN